MTSRSQTGCFSEDLARTPGPGRYNTLDPNSVKGKAPAYSLLGRNNLPGGMFCFMIHFICSAAILFVVIVHPILHYIVLPFFSDSTQKPGPGAHMPEKVIVNRKAAPSFSLGIRHSEFVTPLIVEIAEWNQLLKLYIFTSDCFFKVRHLTCFTQLDIYTCYFYKNVLRKLEVKSIITFLWCIQTVLIIAC